MDNIVSILEVDKSRSQRGSTNNSVELPSIVRPMALSEEKIRFMVQKVEKYAREGMWAIDDRLLDIPIDLRMVGFVEGVDLVLEVGDFGGAILLTHLDIGRSAEISIMLWKREVLRHIDEGRQVLRWAIHSFKLNRIYANLTEKNRLARRFDEKLGFRQEGIARRSLVINGAPTDILVLSVIREEVLTT